MIAGLCQNNGTQRSSGRGSLWEIKKTKGVEIVTPPVPQVPAHLLENGCQIAVPVHLPVRAKGQRNLVRGMFGTTQKAAGCLPGIWFTKPTYPYRQTPASPLRSLLVMVLVVVSGYGYGGGGGGGGGGAVVDPEPSKTEARAIVMAGMKQYLGREASKKEVNSFFEKFKAFSVENKDTGVSAGMQTEFMEDWIEDRPQLRKQEAQYKVNTQFMGVLEDVISNARSL